MGGMTTISIGTAPANNGHVCSGRDCETKQASNPSQSTIMTIGSAPKVSNRPIASFNSPPSFTRAGELNQGVTNNINVEQGANLTLHTA